MMNEDITGFVGPQIPYNEFSRRNHGGAVSQPLFDPTDMLSGALGVGATKALQPTISKAAAPAIETAESVLNQGARYAQQIFDFVRRGRGNDEGFDLLQQFRRYVGERGRTLTPEANERLWDLYFAADRKINPLAYADEVAETARMQPRPQLSVDRQQIQQNRFVRNLGNAMMGF